MSQNAKGNSGCARRQPHTRARGRPRPPRRRPAARALRARVGRRRCPVPRCSARASARAPACTSQGA
eukprot:4479196-Pleurochrysis_carterae.AAC.3